MTTIINVEYRGKKLDTKEMMDEFKLIWKEKGEKIKDISSLELYYKPEEAMCYYVVNLTESGKFSVESN